MTAAGWTVTRVPFTYNAAEVPLTQTAPGAHQVWPANDATGTGEGDVSGTVIPVDINITTNNNANTSGCEGTGDADVEPGGANDFALLDFSGPNDIALVQRGTCAFGDKALNAETAGAEAVIIFNQGNTGGSDDRFGPVNPSSWARHRRHPGRRHVVRRRPVAGSARRHRHGRRRLLPASRRRT